MFEVKVHRQVDLPPPIRKHLSGLVTSCLEHYAQWIRRARLLLPADSQDGVRCSLEIELIAAPPIELSVVNDRPAVAVARVLQMAQTLLATRTPACAWVEPSSAQPR